MDEAGTASKLGTKTMNVDFKWRPVTKDQHSSIEEFGAVKVWIVYNDPYEPEGYEDMLHIENGKWFGLPEGWTVSHWCPIPELGDPMESPGQG